MANTKRGSAPISRQRESRREIEFPSEGAELEGHIARLVDDLANRRERYKLARRRVRLRQEIADRMEELADLMPRVRDSNPMGDDLLAKHHPDDWPKNGMEELFIKPGKRGEPAEWVWLERAEKYLIDDYLAEALDPTRYRNDRDRALESVRSMRSAIKKAREKDELEMSANWPWPSPCGDNEHLGCLPSPCGDANCPGCAVCIG